MFSSELTDACQIWVLNQGALRDLWRSPQIEMVDTWTWPLVAGDPKVIDAAIFFISGTQLVIVPFTFKGHVNM
jgi:hypothetical protein